MRSEKRNAPSTDLVRWARVGQSAVFRVPIAVRFKGKIYSIVDKPAGEGNIGKWNQEAFNVLYQVFQMTVTDVTRVSVPSITISK
jgi:hypothetical protein